MPSATINSPERVFVKVGEPVSFICETSGHPKPEVLWKKDEVLIQPSDAITLNDNVLNIQEVKILDEGQYYCIAENMVGSTKDKRFLFVHGT